MRGRGGGGGGVILIASVLLTLQKLITALIPVGTLSLLLPCKTWLSFLIEDDMKDDIQQYAWVIPVKDKKGVSIVNAF